MRERKAVRKMLVFGVVFLMIFVVFAGIPMNVGAEGTEEPEFPEETPETWNELENGWSVDANGTYFEITNSSYLNITLTSSENVHVYMESIPKMISFHIEPNCTATSTDITITGFEANKTYYRYQDGYLHEEFTTDETGSYSYTQDISTHHHVFIQETKSTVVINSDGSVSDPTKISRNGEIYTQIDDIYDSVSIRRSGITFDGNGYSITGPGPYGIFAHHRSEITITNAEVSGFSDGIILDYSDSSTISGNTVSNSPGNYGGIELYGSDFCTISGNTVSNCDQQGIQLRYSVSSTISGNTVSDNYMGIKLYRSGSSTIKENIVSDNNVGIRLKDSGSSIIYHNTFISIRDQLSIYNSESTWDNGAGEGNYWDDYIGLDDGTDGRVAGDGIGDTNLPHQGVDWYPFMDESGWVHGTTPPGTNVPVTFPEEGATLTFQEVISGGTTTCTVTETGPPPPTGFRLVPFPPPTYYEITTTATYTGLITICINYDASGLEPGQEANLNLRQYDEATSEWVVITTSLNIDDNIICGETDHLSFFGIMLRLNDPPVANAGGPYDSVEGTEITFDASDSTDPDGDLLQYCWDFDNDGNWDTEYSMDPTATHTWYDDYSGTVKVEVYDGKDTDTDVTIVIVNNVAPTATLGNNGPKIESSTVTASFTNQYDPGTSDTFTYSFDWDNDGTYDIVDQASASAQYTWYDNDVYTVKGKIKDNNDGYSEYTTDVTVNNIAPTISSIEGPVYPVQVGTSVDLTGIFTDPGTLDTHTWEINWGDEITSGDVSGYTVTEFHTYTEAGVYTIKLKVTDDDGDSDSMEFRYVVVYDPEGGFVTGGGWIYSEAGAYKRDLSAEGKANFGFVSKYKKGTTEPIGNTEFQFKAGDLNFHSDSYEWLVVAGAKAQYKGIGTINGEGTYKFMISAIDGDKNGDGNDKFRIKIWEEDGDGNEIIIYDNNMNADDDAEPTTFISGGEIVVHTSKK